MHRRIPHVRNFDGTYYAYNTHLIHISDITFALKQPWSFVIGHFTFVFTRIHKTLYSCKMVDESPPEQIALVKERCENKEACEIKQPRDIFTKSQCPSKFFPGIWHG